MHIGEKSTRGKDEKWWKKYRNALASQVSALNISEPPDVDKPTCKIVGPVDKVDQKDTILARYVLKRGSSEYEEYYRRHPESKL